MSLFTKEYIVTIKNRDDLESFYKEMETGVGSEFIPNRPTECIAQRPLSRNTHYLLTPEEAETLSKDPRILAVEMPFKEKGVKLELYGSQTATWSKSNSISVGQKNWGLYRCTKNDNDANWGSDTGTTDVTETINLPTTGANVDVVVIDENVFPQHEEYASRFTQYDWFANHNSTVWAANPNANYAYTTFSSRHNHATHVAGIIGGTTQGWAKGANLYNINHDTYNYEIAGYPTGTYIPLDYVIDYVVAFHNAKTVNPSTGVKNPTLVNCSWGLAKDIFAENNPLTFNNRYSKIVYRGSTITPDSLGNSPVDTGFSGICSNTTKFADITSVTASSGNRITTSGFTTASSTSITFSQGGRTGLSDLGAPTSYDTNALSIEDDAYWEIVMPFNVEYLGNTYGPTGDSGTKIAIGSNSYITFGGGSVQYITSASSPLIKKIQISSGDRSCQKVFGGVSGTAPNRIYRVRFEGHNEAAGGVTDSPTMVWEAVFYEAIPAQIDIHVVSNSAYRGEFTSAQIGQYGLKQNGYPAPIRNTALDADITDAIAAGIVFVGSAGNGDFVVDSPSGQDYNNYFVDNGIEYYYNRGSSPSAVPGVICVGNVDSNSNQNKNLLSNAGLRVDLYAPGTNIVSSVYDSFGNASVSGWTSTPVNNGETILNISSVSRTTNVATITTTAAHGLSTGNRVTIDCSNSSFNTGTTSITVTGLTTFTYSNTGSDLGSTSASGTVTPGYLFQKYTGSSMAAAQVTGYLALVLEKYPTMNQTQARQYLLQNTKDGKLTDTGGGVTDNRSLFGGNNKYLYAFFDRQAEGNVFPPVVQWLRPSTGMAFPRPKIRRS